MMFMMDKKTILSILLSCTAVLSQGQSVTSLVALPDPVAEPAEQPEQNELREMDDEQSTRQVTVMASQSQTPVPQRDDRRKVVVFEQKEAIPQTKYREVTGRRIERVDRSELSATFIPKGQWMFGGTVNFQEWDNDDTDFLVIKNMNIKGHTFSLSPAIGYFVAKNVAVGVRYNYSRNYFFLGDFDLNLGEDFNISLQDLYYHQHKHEGCFFTRTYMPMFGSKTFGFFSEVRATYAQTIGKNSTGDPSKNNFDGVYERTHAIGLGFTPGLCVFATNFAAVECSVGMLGVNYRWTDQKHYEDNADEPIYQKRSHSGGANFKFNLFSINIGATLYL